MDANRIAILQSRVTAARSSVEQRKGQRDRLQQHRQALVTSLGEKLDYHDTLTKCMVLMSEAASYAREHMREQVETVTSMALQSVFGGGYQFKLEPYKIGKSDAIDVVVSSPYQDGDQIETSGADSRGGGVVDLQAIAIRIAMLETYQPEIDGSLMLDEPCKHVSADHIQRAGDLLRNVSRSFERQLIMVTHQEHLAALADQLIRIELINGVSEVTAA